MMMIPKIAYLTRDQQIDLPSVPLYDICESIKRQVGGEFTSNYGAREYIREVHYMLLFL